MRRREFLAASVAGLASGLAGCGRTGDGGTGATPTAGSPGDRRIGAVELPVSRGELRAAVPRDRIPAIVDPAFGEDWSGLSVPESSAYDGGPLLPDDSPVVGLKRDGEARAYPLRVLDWHEVVNDGFAGPTLVTYCPLCGTAVVGERRVNGTETVFGVSGYLYRGALVAYDRATGSLWSQLLAAAIRGPATGEELSLSPSRLTSWGEWRESHPDTTVLLPPPRSDTVRGRDATFDYFDGKYVRGRDQLIGYRGRRDEARPTPKTLVVGIARDGEARAYPFAEVRDRNVVNDTVGSSPVVVALAPDGGLVAYERRAGGTTLRFRAAGERHLRAGGSRWERTTGRAVDGPHEGRRLAPTSATPAMFWRGWSNQYPDTEIFPASGTGE